MQAAAAAEVQTELASRVSNWRHKIQPLLDEQDARPSFDIHLYGDQVLDKLARLSCKDPAHPVELEASTVCLAYHTIRHVTLPCKGEATVVCIAAMASMLMHC